MASPIIFRCRKTGFRFFFGFATPKDWRDKFVAYTSNMLVFFRLHCLLAVFRIFSEFGGKLGKKPMKTTRAVGVGVAFVLAITFISRGQALVPASPAGTISLTATNVATLKSLTDAQLATLVNALEATPTIAAEDLPRGGMVGNFYSLAHPDWPPLPSDIRQIPVWDLGAGFYLLDDLDYPESSAADGGLRAMDSLSSLEFDGGDGFTANFQPQAFTTNDLWLQIAQMTNSTVSLVIHSPWDVTNGVYDLFATTNLAPSAWQWVLRCAPGQTNLTVTNLTTPNEFFILGLTNDNDGDGLSDAFELLVSHTNPNLPSTDNTGMSDGWEWQYFGSISNNPSADPDGDGLTTFQEFQMRSAGYNPTVWDSNTNAVSDAYEDYSGDGLANFMEAAFGGNMMTNNPAWKADVDNDGLPDLYETMAGSGALGLPSYSKNPLP